MVQLLTEESVSTLTDKLIETIDSLRHEKKFTSNIKQFLATNYSLSPGQVQGIINDTSKIKGLNSPELYVYAEAVYNFTEKEEVDPDKYYPTRMAKEIATEFKGETEETVSFPYVFEGIEQVAEDDFIGTIKASEIKKLMDSQLIQYNFDTQREARLRKNSKTEEIIPIPKVNESSVNEIVNLIKNDDLISSMLTFNARLGSGDTPGEEIIYNSDDRTLTINPGTLFDCMDGFHRVSGIVTALLQYPDKDMIFKINILNFTVEKARAYFAQMNTVNPVSKAQIERFAKKNYSTFVVEQLEYSSELKSRVSTSHGMNSKAVVTFNTLTAAIDENWSLKNKFEAIQLSKYLGEFINNLFYAYPEEFLGDSKTSRPYLTMNNMFFGYMKLAKRMQENNVSLMNLNSILDKIDFSKDSKDFTSTKGKGAKQQLDIIRNVFSDISVTI
ncbi:DNA-sulfur modification-associated [Terribacillus aidingensis]|uniref:DNA-sulfur modification-associated n=1 Tax=Terribacillus aidingensis TaxID=586416 RepID=A0A285NQ77_9BACI|nr:DNA sulfur modification protein DndB [Terribacillus aidingensis]SNZ10006.1 DNA-sulfur modification-associated [Terribacillus aidingensis]